LKKIKYELWLLVIICNRQTTTDLSELKAHQKVFFT
jgi:hypothetical protein